MATQPSVDILNGSQGEAGAHEHRETWLDAAMPWASSFMMHAGIGLVAAFAFYAMVSGRTPEESPQIPSAVSLTEDLTHSSLQAPGLDKTRPTEQQELLNALTKGFDPQGKQDGDISKIAGTGDRVSMEQAWAIGGNGGGLALGMNGLGKDGPGLLAPPGKPGGGDPTSILPPTRGAMRVVYLLDHSGSMLDTFDFLKVEVKNRINSLLPIQKYSVIMFSEDVTVLGPDQLVPATNENKRAFCLKMDEVRAQGQNDDMLPPFKQGFEKAFSMKPEMIVFLTDGNFDEHLVPIVKGLNKDGKVQISTVAYVQITPQSEAQLKQIAAENGGKYKFVSEKDLGR